MKKIIYAIGLLVLTASCDDDALTNLNLDEKNPSTVPASSLFTSAEKTLTDQMVNSNVNRNVFRLANQQWTETTYLDESIYNWTSRKISERHWDALYAGPLADLAIAKKNLESSEILSSDPEFKEKTTIKKNQLALIDILMVYTFQVLVDTFGDVPYSEALKGSGDYMPKYDKAIDIYKDLIVRLDKDLERIDSSSSAFGSADVIYNDDLEAWIKFANSIKLKLGINLKASGLETTVADAAIKAAASHAFTSNSDNAKLRYMADLPNTNPIYVDLVFSGRHDFVPASTFVDAVVAKNDPRVKAYFAQNLVDASGNPAPYKGGVVGTKNSYGKYTHVSDAIQEPDFKGTLLDYSEVEFLLAEAAARGVAVSGSVESHYVKAIRASMDDWGISVSDADTYLAQTSVAYTTATGTWKQKIGEQSWYAKYNRGFEGWTSTRRLNFPMLTAPSNADPAAEGQVPSRMAYPIREQTLNAVNYQAASAAIGGDKLKTKIFWDID
ncbi:SusD/RagB family nutrient-binding outer membrane lipoprotein [Flavobacterium procerum]|uniref:SusD/RagB family nutrient-binding outer membrane lipoprotein n=1 Tax=Flavobacterium procerum TaxID=1455569 RepID=A0ABV6BKB2_9FLAO